jgi:DNA-binding CsgD family transcriptional regulator
VLGGNGTDPEALPAETVRILGRESERAAIREILEQARGSRSGVLVLRGEAGVGKSALLDLALRSAPGMLVLRATGVEPESGLPFAALHQLLRPLLSRIDGIPPVQADALRIAMGVAPGITENRFVIALAVLDLLAEAAAETPVLCLIDDAHWLDQSSSDALAFVARRVDAEGIAMLFSLRDGEPSSFSGAGLAVRTVARLEPDEATQLLLERYGSELAAEVRNAIVGSAHGLPLALLEIPASLTPEQRSGRDPLPRPMPVGRRSEEVLLQRTHHLSEGARMLLLVAAAEGSGESDVVLAAAAVLGIAPTALLEAEESGLIRSEDSTLAFRHPMVRSAVYQAAAAQQRQMVHRALVEVLEGESNEDRRAWHRAALVLYPDEELAEELERTADRARRRGGHAAACEALRRAAELTPSDEQRARRLAAAARAAWDAGLVDEARALASVAEAEMPGDSYADLRHVQGEIEFNCGNPRHGAAILIDGADRVALASPHKALRMLFDAALCANWAGDFASVQGAARRASILALGDAEAESRLIELLAGVAAMLQGKEPGSPTALLQALDRIADTDDPRWLTWAAVAASLLGEREREAVFRQRAEMVARRSMSVGDLTLVLARIAWADMVHGRVMAAADRADEGLRLASEAALTNPMCFHRAILAWVAALRGDDESCVAFAELASGTALRQGLAAHLALAGWATGLLQLGFGRWEEAMTRLQDVTSGSPGVTHPYIARLALPDLVEAAFRSGSLEVAASAADRFASSTHDGAPASDVALAARCRALIADHPGDAEKLLSDALVFHDRDPRPFQRARTLLILGEHLRRERRRREARTPLRAALVTYEQLGAHPWAERARRELRATGETIRPRDRVTATELTPQERQVIGLVAEGATNREVAAQMFLSHRTVEYHLRSVFSKLGISSRAELIRRHVEDAKTNVPD